MKIQIDLSDLEIEFDEEETKELIEDIKENMPLKIKYALEEEVQKQILKDPRFKKFSKEIAERSLDIIEKQENDG